MELIEPTIRNIPTVPRSLPIQKNSKAVPGRHISLPGTASLFIYRKGKSQYGSMPFFVCHTSDFDDVSRSIAFVIDMLPFEDIIIL